MGEGVVKDACRGVVHLGEPVDAGGAEPVGECVDGLDEPVCDVATRATAWRGRGLQVAGGVRGPSPSRTGWRVSPHSASLACLRRGRRPVRQASPNLGVDHVKIKSPSAASGHPTSRTAALDLGQHGNGCSVRLVRTIARCESWVPLSSCAQRAVARRAATTRGAERRSGGSATTHLRCVVRREARCQRLGPSPGGGPERGRDRCCSGDVVVLCLPAGTAPEVAESGFGVCGSWSRMRHHRAAAGWSSGRGPAAAADRRRWVAWKPARLRLVSLSSSSGRNGSAVALGAALASSCRHCRSVRVSAASSCPSSCCCQTRAAQPSWGWPGRSQVAWVDLDGGAPHLHVGDQLGRHQGVRLGCPGRRFTFGAEADLVGELSHQL